MSTESSVKYLYAGARIKSLETELLNPSQVDRLIAAADWSQAYEALQDTFLGPHITTLEPDKPDMIPLERALDQVMIESKALLKQIAPEPKLLDLLWFKYDWHNLKILILNEKTNQEEFTDLTFDVGNFSFKKLSQAYKTDQLTWLDPTLNQAKIKAKEAKSSEEIGVILNYYYFNRLKDLAGELNNPFIKDLVILMIDLFNLKTALRQKILRQNGGQMVYINGGTFSSTELSNPEDILAGFGRLDQSSHWSEAITNYQNTGHLTAIKKAAEEHLMNFLKIQSMPHFNPAALFAYFAARKNNVQIINIIMTGKQNKAKDSDIKDTLRQLYRTL